jgi:hypothetical protein
VHDGDVAVAGAQITVVIDTAADGDPEPDTYTGTTNADGLYLIQVQWRGYNDAADGDPIHVTATYGTKTTSVDDFTGTTPYGIDLNLQENYVPVSECTTDIDCASLNIPVQNGLVNVECRHGYVRNECVKTITCSSGYLLEGAYCKSEKDGFFDEVAEALAKVHSGLSDFVNKTFFKSQNESGAKTAVTIALIVIGVYALSKL